MKTISKASAALLAPFILATISPSALARIGNVKSPHLPSIVPMHISTRNDEAAHQDRNRRSTSVILSSAADRINNGRMTSPGQYAFFSQMWWNGVPQGCGGSLIASKWILTAAHCVIPHLSKISGTGFPEWRVGGYCQQSDNCGATQQVIRSKRAIIHPWHNAQVPKWDFALLELSETAFATPVPIDHDSSKFNALQLGSPVRGLGMGFTNDEGHYSYHLLEVDNHFLPVDLCGQYYTTGDAFDDSVMCTNGANFGMCDGDSGGPVVVNDPGSPYQFTQVSITSFGAWSCENHNYPDGSARIGAAGNWIKDTVCLSYGPSEGNRPPFCPPPAPVPNPTQAPLSNPTPAPLSNPTPAPLSNPTPAPQPDPTPAPQPDPTPAPQQPTPAPQPDPTQSPQSDPTLKPSGLPEVPEIPEQPQSEEPAGGNGDPDGDCLDSDRFFHLKKRKHRACKKVRGKKIKKFCKNNKTNARQSCPRACGTCAS